MGRKKIDSQVKKARGTYQPVRDVKVNANGNVFSIPDPPEHFTKTESEMWYRVVAYLVEKQRLRIIHLPQIERYCTWCEVYAACMVEVRSEGAVMVYTNDNAGVSAWLKAAKEAQTQMIQFEKAFGLTPSTDSALPQPVDVYDDDDEFRIR